MAIQVREEQWQESYHRVTHLLPALTREELDVIHAVAEEFMKNPAIDRGIRPLSAQEIWSRVDHGIEQVNQGEVLTLEEVMADLDKEFGL